MIFAPIELIEKLAALTPRPRINLILYHGVLAPHARWRARVVAYGLTQGRQRRLRIAGVIRTMTRRHRAILDSLAVSAGRLDRAPPPVPLEPATLATQA